MKPKTTPTRKTKAVKAKLPAMKEVWAPVFKDTNEFVIGDQYEGVAKPKDCKGEWTGRDITHVRAQVVPLPPSRRGRR